VLAEAGEDSSAVLVMRGDSFGHGTWPASGQRDSSAKNTRFYQRARARPGWLRGQLSALRGAV